VEDKEGGRRGGEGRKKMKKNRKAEEEKGMTEDEMFGWHH